MPECRLQGSFLPLPPLQAFDTDAVIEGTSVVGGAITPGEFIADTAPGIELNVGRSLIELMVTNSGDRAIQVGSHYHFIETNRALVFDRAQSLGFRLSVPSGASVRFEPGEVKTVTLVEIAGEKNVVSGNLLVSLSFAPPPPGRSCGARHRRRRSAQCVSQWAQVYRGDAAQRMEVEWILCSAPVQCAC